ncbi:MAG: alpha/beta fold hydrolase [Burkholderiales bacterium]|nr:alpha/beta fold hydrolase [Burkholderiales bacterium]
MIGEFEIALPHGVTLACRGNQAPPAFAAPAARVLLVHGFPEAAFVWDEVLEALAPEVAGIAPQMRGYAGSSAPAEPAAYRAKHLVADLAALIERCGAPLDLLVAHDWGGAVAWALAAQRPHLLRQLLIVNSPHPATFLRELKASEAQQRASAYMTFLCRPDAEALLAEDDFRRLWRLFGARAEPRWLSAAMKDRYRAVWRGGLNGPLNYYRASPLRPAQGPDDRLHELVLDDAAVTVRVPTHVLWGEQDHALLPGLLEGLERWVPALTVERVPEASHWIVHEQPARVAATIRRLLARPATGPA